MCWSSSLPNHSGVPLCHNPRHPKCPLCLDETGIVGKVLCCRATAARDLTAHGQPGEATQVPAARLFLPSQGRAGTLPNPFLLLTELRGVKHEEQPCPQQGNTCTDGLHQSKECSDSTTDMGLDSTSTTQRNCQDLARVLWDFY